MPQSPTLSYATVTDTVICHSLRHCHMPQSPTLSYATVSDTVICHSHRHCHMPQSPTLSYATVTDTVICHSHRHCHMPQSPTLSYATFTDTVDIYLALFTKTFIMLGTIIELFAGMIMKMKTLYYFIGLCKYNSVTYGRGSSGGLMARAPDCRSRGRWFDSKLGQFRSPHFACVFRKR